MFARRSFVALMVLGSCTAGCESGDCPALSDWLAEVRFGYEDSGAPVVEIWARADLGPGGLEDGCGPGESTWVLLSSDIDVRPRASDEELVGPEPEWVESVRDGSGSRWDFEGTLVDVGWQPDHVWVEPVDGAVSAECRDAPSGQPSCVRRDR